MIRITSQFQEAAALPIEYKMVVADITARDALDASERYDGLQTYVIATNENWQLQGGITNPDWVLLGSGGGMLPLTQYHIYNGDAGGAAQDSGTEFLWDEVLKNLSVGDLAASTNGIKFLLSNTGESVLLGKAGVGIGKFSLDNSTGDIFIGAGNTAGTSPFPINFAMSASTGEIAAGDTSGSNYFTANQDNTAFGVAAGDGLTSGVENAFFGKLAGLVTSSGGRNSFFGFQAGSANTTGIGNSVFGWDAGLNITTGSHNTFLGQQAGNHITSSDNNVAVGYSALFDNVTGLDNVAVGVSAGNSNLGKENVFIGSSAGLSFTGNDSVFIGYIAAQNFDGSNSVFIGRGVAASDTASSDSLIIGNNADGGGNQATVLGNTANSGSGKWNTIIGESSGSASLSGNGTTIVGRNAGVSITSGGFNTLLGYGTDVPSGTREYGIALGAYAQTGDNILSIGGDDGAGNGYIDQVLIGNGTQNSSPHPVIMSLTSYDSSATDTSGKDFTFRPGLGTGTGLAGDFVMGAGSPGTSSTTSNSNIDTNRFNGNSVQTTNATPTNMPVLYPDSDATYVFEALVVARYLSGGGGTAGDSAGYFIRGTFKSIGGTLTQIGTTARDIWEDVAGYDANFAIVSNVLEVQVTGVASATINWKVSTQFTRIVL